MKIWVSHFTQRATQKPVYRVHANRNAALTMIRAQADDAFPTRITSHTLPHKRDVLTLMDCLVRGESPLQLADWDQSWGFTEEETA